LLSENGSLDPYHESFIENEFYVAIHCDQFAFDEDHRYLVSVTRHKTTPDAFGYGTCEAQPFLHCAWLSSIEDAKGVYKKYCIDMINGEIDG